MTAEGTVGAPTCYVSIEDLKQEYNSSVTICNVAWKLS
jgi:hypothetical protein